MANLIQQRQKRRARIRAKVKGTKSRPRLSVFRSNAHIFAQIIDDEKGTTLTSFSTKKIADKEAQGKTKGQKAFMVGEELAKLSQEQKINAVVFDRGGYQYHGRVKQVAEGARKGGLKF